MFSRVSQLIVTLATVACTLLFFDPSAEAQMSRRQARINARNMRTGRATYSNYGSRYNSGFNYGTGGYYGRYGTGYGGYGGPGFYGPGYGGMGYGGMGYGPIGGRGYGGGTYGGPGSFAGGPVNQPGYGAPPAGPRAVLGITMSETPDGVIRVSGVRPGSPAEQSGLQPGDVLLALDGRELYTSREVTQIVARHSPGDAVLLDIDRNGFNDRVEAVLGDQSGQFAGNAPNGMPPAYGRPGNMGPGPMMPMQARRGRNQNVGPNQYNGGPVY